MNASGRIATACLLSSDSPRISILRLGPVALIPPVNACGKLPTFATSLESTCSFDNSSASKGLWQNGHSRRTILGARPRGRSCLTSELLGLSFYQGRIVTRQRFCSDVPWSEGTFEASLLPPVLLR